jgi:hypothetical protein
LNFSVMESVEVEKYKKSLLQPLMLPLLLTMML